MHNAVHRLYTDPSGGIKRNPELAIPKEYPYKQKGKIVKDSGEKGSTR